MNKSELVTAMATKSELTKKDAEKALDSFEQVVLETLAEGGKVQLVGFGTFEVVPTKPRMQRNPKTGEELGMSEAGKRAKFKVGKQLKEAVK